jgi:hypothetical protein
VASAASAPNPGAQDGGDHLRHRGLAVAAGDRDQRQALPGAPGARQLHQCLAGVGHLQAGQGKRRERLLRHHRHRTGGQGLRQKVVGVEALSLQRHEQVAALQGAGVGVHTAEAQLRVADQGAAQAPRAQRLKGLAKGPVHKPARSISAARACTRSSKGWRTPATSW